MGFVCVPPISCFENVPLSVRSFLDTSLRLAVFFKNRNFPVLSGFIVSKVVTGKNYYKWFLKKGLPQNDLLMQNFQVSGLPDVTMKEAGLF